MQFQILYLKTDFIIIMETLWGRKLANLILHLHLFRLHTRYICIYMVFCSLLQTLHRDIFLF